MARREQLRIGLLVDDLAPPSWLARVIRDVHASTEAQLVVVVRRGAPSLAEREGSTRPFPRAMPRAMRRAADLIDARAFRLPHDALAPTSVADVVRSVPLIDAPVLSDALLAQLAGYRLDVALQFCRQGVSGRALAMARFGVWSFVYGDGADDAQIAPAGLFEIIAKGAVTASSLVAVGADGDTRVLYESWARTDPISARRNRANCYAKSSAFVMRALRRLHEHGPESLPAPRRATEHAPRAAHVARSIARLGTLVSARARNVAARKQWILAYGIDGSAIGAVPTRSLAKLGWAVPPADRFWADPFVVRQGDGWVVLFEERIFAERNAHIAAFEIDRSGRRGEAFRVLECDYHLSYPFVFRWDDAWWMVPESSMNGTVDLWRAEQFSAKASAAQFPRTWTRERTLLDGVRAVDATLLEHDGKWWMFCNIGEPGASKDDELHIFHAATPLGPWRAHRTNPVKSDVRSARPAGRLFWQDGAWHRPAQDSSDGYGARIILHRIDRLDVDGYAEHEVARLSPDWRNDLVGLHTINACDGLTVIDLRIERPRLRILDRYR